MSVEVETMKGIVDEFVTFLRKEPKPTSEIEVILLQYAKVEVDEAFVDPYWYKVESATGCIGYLPKKFLAIIKKG